MSIKVSSFLSLVCVGLGLGCADKGGIAGKTYTTFSSIYAGDNSGCASFVDGRTMCWGANNSGQLGLGDTNNRGDDVSDFIGDRLMMNVGTGRTVRTLAGGSEHTCAILDNGTLKCWGENLYGQLGYGDSSYRAHNIATTGDGLATVDLGTGRTALAVGTGRYHTCALLDNATVKCWGLNNEGQLGKDSTSSAGASSNQMGDTLTAINLGAGRTATAIAAGGSFSCAILDNATVKCWGANSLGQLGQGSSTALGDAAGEMAALAAIDLGTGRTATAISAGDYSTCALLDNATVKCWGEGFFGNLGQENFLTLGDAGGEMGDALAAINLGTGRTALSIHVRGSRTCAVLDNRTAKCWGLNDYGALGQGNTTDLGQVAGQMGDNLLAINLGTGRTVQSLAMGTDHTCALLDNGFVKCWGRNLVAQLGNGDTVSRGDDSGEMGDALPAVNGINMQVQ